MFGLGNQDRTDITVVLDRSGSMQAVYGQTVEGFAAFVEKQQKLPGDCRLTLVQFDTVFETVYRNRPIHRVGRLDLRPRGATALLDAMGYAVQQTAERIEAQRIERRPARVIMVIITDGQENSSREFTRQQVFSMVKNQTNRHDWQFVFLGANQDAIREATSMGIDAGAAMTYNATPLATKAVWSAMADAVGRHRAAGKARMCESYFTDQERLDARQE